MNRAQVLRIGVIAILATAGLFWMNSFAPLQWPSVLAYSGLVVFLGGLLAAVVPCSWSGFARRSHGLLIGCVTGSALVALALIWPVDSYYTIAGSSAIDEFMPNYHFQERHEILVNAPAERTRQAFEQFSFADIPVMETLGRIRATAMRVHTERGATPSPIPIAKLIRDSRTGFFLLADTPNEFVFGLAGQPWNNAGVRLTANEFRAWNTPGNIKVAANIRIVDAGNGQARLITETRIEAVDEAAQHKMQRYWALIYPGSGLIRKSMLTAIKARAENTGVTAVQ